MVGMFKTKKVDDELLKKNVTDAIINIWSDSQKLRYEKFLSFIESSVNAAPSGDGFTKFMTEKLRYTTCVAIISLGKAGIDESVINEIIAMAKSEVSSSNITELKRATAALGLKSQEYATIRFSTNPREAGKMIENKFSQQAFGFVPSDDDIDRRYTLYKELSSFERKTIYAISDAIRKSRI